MFPLTVVIWWWWWSFWDESSHLVYNLGRVNHAVETQSAFFRSGRVVVPVESSVQKCIRKSPIACLANTVPPVKQHHHQKSTILFQLPQRKFSERRLTTRTLSPGMHLLPTKPLLKFLTSKKSYPVSRVYDITWSRQSRPRFRLLWSLISSDEAVSRWWHMESACGEL